jgi:nicotinamidase-related amidase
MTLARFTQAHVLAEAKRQYESGVADFSIDPRRLALIVVDMLDEFVKPEWCAAWVPEATAQVPRIRRVIRASRVPVIYLAYEVSLQGLNGPRPLLYTPIGRRLRERPKDSPWFRRVAIYDELKPQDGDLVVLKHTYSGFHNTPLDAVLRNLGVETVMICGTVTNYCCGATAREAFWHGYHVIVGSDICSSDDAEIHEAELKVLRRGYARIMTAEDIIARLAQQVGATPDAKGV